MYYNPHSIDQKNKQIESDKLSSVGKAIQLEKKASKDLNPDLEVYIRFYTAFPDIPVMQTRGL